MKKITLFLTAFLIISSLTVQVQQTEAAYLPEYDKYIEVSYEDARKIADILGLKNVELGEETAKITFDVQEAVIAKLEKVLKKEIDHYYIWLTVNGQPVIGIDPPFAMY
ncbi:8-amino-7-oxononanoate synthase [Cytobacillus purgationiresistens]|uniref:Membrane-bound lytic murein transglycosylase MltF n=1 Tax=Cytobacillus purgationiresistens TaxID=863449 RepID=A0ABU0AM58_9BACI|nr:8-amino-7-oxononanoate synthase [Cytobacillus purgationiresistens]MDQ0272338.1 membrane-bound lytic murein transglycosylase MltF [Cytobacillus purgationiresistens]